MAVNADRESTHPTVADYVLGVLRERILNGALPVGERLDQQALAVELGVSVIPVRESLRQLEAEGLVRIYPRRGVFVADLSPADLEEIYIIREPLEGLAARLAVPHLEADNVARLGEVLKEMAAATAGQDFPALFELNRLFHFTLYEASGLPLLCQIISSLWDRSSFYRRLYTHLVERADQALAEHRVIYDACAARDADAVEQAVRQNVRQTAEAIAQTIKTER